MPPPSEETIALLSSRFARFVRLEKSLDVPMSGWDLETTGNSCGNQSSKVKRGICQKIVLNHEDAKGGKVNIAALIPIVNYTRTWGLSKI